MTTRSSYMTLLSKDMPKEYPITKGRQGMKARNGSSSTTEFTTHKSLAKFVWFSIARQSPREILSMTSRWKIQISLTHTWASLVDSNRSVWQLWQTLSHFSSGENSQLQLFVSLLFVVARRWPIICFGRISDDSSSFWHCVVTSLCQLHPSENGGW